MAMFKSCRWTRRFCYFCQKVTQKTFDNRTVHQKSPCALPGLTSGGRLFHNQKRIMDLFIPVSLPAHIPDLHNKVSPPVTILLPDSSPFWSVPIHHLPALPVLLRSEILYQSISLMIIIHIFHYCCYILIFPVSSFPAPFQSVNGIVNGAQKILKVNF